LIVPLLCIWPLSAGADDGEAARLISECSAPDLPQASVDSCLERVRVLEETDASSQLQTLEATLSQRESGGPVSTRAAAVVVPPVAEVSRRPDGAFESTDEQNRSVSQNAERDSFPRHSRSELEDQPPVADPPDEAQGEDRPSDSETGDPGQQL
jgi:hypothetical protein